MVGSRVLQGESLEAFNEGVGYILNRWPPLRSAVDYQQGGENSHLKAEKLIGDVRSWFTQSNEPLHIDDLKNLIYEGMVAAFDLKICDESDGDIAVELMVIHEDCLNGDFRNIEHLRKASRFDDFSVHITIELGFGCVLIPITFLCPMLHGHFP
ncbi:putative pre-rRNA-processing protein TSR2 [Medicago truncatula]|uniref:Putative pre-rRNA-processing protein TSR2 n=1 Tax=Medicago truncatula TaxID=3880 RepID=A0A396GIS7_MEDTR|nr:putative pre-rRNA-processing protein TSR2 [Medicago truncatula]